MRIKCKKCGYEPEEYPSPYEYFEDGLCLNCIIGEEYADIEISMHRNSRLKVYGEYMHGCARMDIFPITCYICKCKAEYKVAFMHKIMRWSDVYLCEKHAKYFAMHHIEKGGIDSGVNVLRDAKPPKEAVLNA